MAAPALELWCWRHPPARGAAGRCIGRTDLRVDARKAKRLAHRIRTAARRHALPRAVCVSTLQRSAQVGAWLRRWGWRVRSDARLCELDFGAWDGRPWSGVAWHEVEAWQADLLHHAPGGGETLAALALRVRAFVADASLRAGGGAAVTAVVTVVTHGGWINALRHVPPGAATLAAAGWPAAPKHGSLTRWAGA